MSLNVIPFASAARTETTNSDDQSFPGYPGSVALFLDVSAASGTTPTLDVKLQAKKSDATYLDIPGGTFTQKTAVSTEGKTFPMVTIMQDKDGPSTGTWRAVATIGGGTPSFTFSLKGIVLAEG